MVIFGFFYEFHTVTVEVLCGIRVCFDKFNTVTVEVLCGVFFLL